VQRRICIDDALLVLIDNSQNGNADPSLHTA
jgi:hypothetical protein